jgi:hypothetical protein
VFAKKLEANREKTSNAVGGENLRGSRLKGKIWMRVEFESVERPLRGS